MNKHYKALELDSVLKMLSECAVSKEARQKALQLKPCCEIGSVRACLDKTACAYSLAVRYGFAPFSNINNVQQSLQKAAAGAMLGADELLETGTLLRAFRKLLAWYASCAEKSGELDIYFDSVYQNRYFEDKIFSIILSSDEIADKASAELYEIRRKIRAKENGVREKLDSMIHSAYYQKFLQEAIVTQRNGRYVLPVKAENRGEIDGLVHDTSSSGATVFIEPASVVQANNEIKILQGQERDEIQRILLELSGEAACFAENINISYSAAVQLDLIFAKASLAFKMKAAKPQLNEDGVIDLKKARHPLLEPQKVVPTDISLGTGFDTLVITGPNTGGKTVSLKTLGLLTLMTMCGMMIPALENSTVCPFAKVLADIGDEQSIQQNLSTFSAHMVNIIEIINASDENTLILIDELGAGTDPVEGAALAVSIIDTLRARGAKIAATTHYTELKAYALETPGIMNASCEFDVNTLMPTYKLLMGVPGKSNAFAISLRLGMDSRIVKNAKSLVNSQSRSFESALTRLEEDRRRLQQEISRAEKEAETADKMKRAAQSQKDKILSIEETEIKRAKHEAQKIINEAKRKSSEFLLELDRLKNEATAADYVKRAKRKIKNSVAGLEDVIRDSTEISEWPQDYKLPRSLQVGDSVNVRNIGKGEVAEVKADGSVLVQCGLMKMRVDSGELMLLPKQKTKAPTQVRVVRTSSKSDGSVKSQIDLRGKTVDEALGELDAFIYSCILSNIETISIIHGKGTGALRQGVHKMLRTHKSVKEFRLGEYGEGDSGITIATLK
ncbi:MAG: endonuclease MutS2 [Clostridiales bacterium]|nr:endonuclease MutS2 [Clostridiales bacterium]